MTNEQLLSMKVPRGYEEMRLRLRSQVDKNMSSLEGSDEPVAFATFGLLAANQAILDAKLDWIIESIKRSKP